MEFDPFAPESISQPAQVAETKPSFWQTVRSNVGNFAKRAGAVLWFAGSMVAFDQANAQEVAIVTPQWKPPIAGLAVPGNPETTAEEAPTAEMIIAILKENVGDIKRKFPTCTDEALAELIGKIALGTIDPKRLETLATTFEENSEEGKAIIAFAKYVGSAPKPSASPQDAVEKKLPPLNETAIQKKIRLAQEEKEVAKKNYISEASKLFMKKSTWKVGTQGKAGVRITNANGLLVMEYEKPKNTEWNMPSEGIGVFRFPIAPGEYKIRIDANTPKVLFWLTDIGNICFNMEGQPGGRMYITVDSKDGQIFKVPEAAQLMTLWFSTTEKNAKVIIKWITLETVK